MLSSLWLLLVILLGTGVGTEAPRVELLTMGEGTDLYERFGHSALRVTSGAEDLVYNFGTTDFSRSDLVPAFLRGHVKFWVSVSSFARTFGQYAAEDRTIWAQEIRLPAEDRRALAAKLRWQALPEHRMYDYDHFTDNCTTRLRDLLDQSARGAVRRRLEARPFAERDRSLVRRGFSGRPDLQILGDLLVGRAVDRPMTAWDASFLPRVLRDELPTALGADGVSIAASPVLLFRRVSAPLSDAPYLGQLLLAAAALLVFGLGFVALLSPGVARAARIGWALFGGGAGLLVVGLALYSTLPLFRDNASLLLFTPLDLPFAFATSPTRRVYQLVRGLGIVAALALLSAPLALGALALAGVFAGFGRDVKS